MNVRQNHAQSPRWCGIQRSEGIVLHHIAKPGSAAIFLRTLPSRLHPLRSVTRLLARRGIQLLRSLRRRTAAGCHHQSGRRPRRRSAPGEAGPASRSFSPPDEWDDTGIFTVAPRPKSVSPWIGDRNALVASIRDPSLKILPPPPFKNETADNHLNVAECLRAATSSGSLCHGLREWTRRRRERGGGGGDAAIEFLDVREAALVSVAEALARRALPWQAQLCPRALQDLDIARVKVIPFRLLSGRSSQTSALGKGPLELAAPRSLGFRCDARASDWPCG